MCSENLGIRRQPEAEQIGLNIPDMRHIVSPYGRKVLEVSGPDHTGTSEQCRLRSFSKCAETVFRLTYDFICIEKLIS